jgi:hypothetical protein
MAPAPAAALAAVVIGVTLLVAGTIVARRSS